MWSGKTEYGILECVRQHRYGKTVVYVTHADDVRYADTAAATSRSHSGLTVEGLLAPPRDNFRSRRLSSEEFGRFRAVVTPLPDVVVIDEGQFFPKLAAVALDLSRDCEVVVCGLDFDSDLRPFGEMHAVPATERVARTGLCAECGDAARYSMRRDTRAAAVEVGGAGTYRVVCAAHHPRFRFAPPLPPLPPS